MLEAASPPGPPPSPGHHSTAPRKEARGCRLWGRGWWPFSTRSLDRHPESGPGNAGQRRACRPGLQGRPMGACVGRSPSHLHVALCLGACLSRSVPSPWSQPAGPGAGPNLAGKQSLGLAECWVRRPKRRWRWPGSGHGAESRPPRPSLLRSFICPELPRFLSHGPTPELRGQQQLVGARNWSLRGS